MSTIAGIGALLAAGVVYVIAARRRQQRRARPAGRRLPTGRPDAVRQVRPNGGGSAALNSFQELGDDRDRAEMGDVAEEYSAALVAEELSTAGFAEAADPNAVLRLDVMLRLLAVDAQVNGTSMPQVHACRIDDAGIELYLAASADLPAPWTTPFDDDSTWAISTQDADVLVQEAFEAETDPDSEVPATITEDVHYADLYAQRLPLRSVEAPYPTLTSLGSDPDGAILMLNLEELSSLAITGPARKAREVLRAIALELSTSSWADSLQVTLVGDLAPELPAALGNERLSHVDDVEHLLRALERRADEVSALMERHRISDLPTARARSLDVDAWTPQLILLGDQLDSDQHRRLRAVVHQLPRVGVAAITAQSEPLGEWVLGLHARSEDAELQPGDVPLRPTRLDDGVYGEILDELRAAASQEWEPGPDWARRLVDIDADADGKVPSTTSSKSTNPAGSVEVDGSGVPVSGAGVPAAAAEGGLAEVPVLEEVEDPYVAGLRELQGDDETPLREDLADDRDGTRADDRAAVADAEVVDVRDIRTDTRAEVRAANDLTPAAIIATATAAVGRVPGTAPVTPETSAIAWTTMSAQEILAEHVDGPVLAFMGPPLLLGARGAEPTGGDASKKTVLVAQMLYLSLLANPNRASFMATFWEQPVMFKSAQTNCTQSLSRIRKWLGEDDQGQTYLPRQEVKLRGVTTDHDVFLQLIGCDVTSAPLPDLIKALELVRGLPFEGGRSHDRRHKNGVVKAHFGPWTEDLRNDVRMEVVDVALHVSNVALHREDFATARRASAVGLLVEPHHTDLTMAALKAAAGAGDEDEVSRLIIRHHAELAVDEREPALSVLQLEAELTEAR